MDLILINDEKLKVILTAQDLERMNINAESLDYSNVSTKRVFWEILDEAREKAGFDAAKSKLYVQVFPSCDGGCEMFVTKFNSSPVPSSKKTEKKTFRLAKNNYTKGVYIILGFNEVCKLSKRLLSEKKKYSTTLYYDISGVYILIAEKSLELPSYISSTYISDIEYPDYFSEYGTVKEINQHAIAYFEEHCKKIIDGNAVEILASL